MQASKVSLGRDYAVNYQGEMHILRVTEMVTTKRRDKTTNSVRGWIDGTKDADGNVGQGTFDVSDLLGEAEQYKSLMEEKARRQAEAKAKSEANDARKRKAAELLGKALGVPVYFGDTKYGEPGYREERAVRDEPHVRAEYTSIELATEVQDALIAFLEGLPKTSLEALRREAAANVQRAIDTDNVLHNES